MIWNTICLLRMCSQKLSMHGKIRTLSHQEKKQIKAAERYITLGIKLFVKIFIPVILEW
jgi:hypothetical protein